jgi:hypothetical protein
MRPFSYEKLSYLTAKGDSFLLRHGPRRFPDKAVEILREVALHEEFDYRDLLRRSFSFSHEQNFKRLEFSDLPVTVARGKRCFIDVYFWRRRPTTIHNHHFTGAFQCLLGKNVEREFTWQEERKLSRFHALGKLTVTRTNTILPGDIHAIRLQDEFIHQSHHHADLTVNLCFRTPDLPGKRLSNFLYSGVKIEKDSDSLRRAEVLYAYACLEEFAPSELRLKREDTLNFLFHTLRTTQNPRILGLQKKLQRDMKGLLGVDVPKLLARHEGVLEKIMMEEA